MRLKFAINADGRQLEISALSMGNPHAAQFVPDVEHAPVQTEGAAIEVRPRFPQHVNARYVQVVNRGHLRLRVFERGADLGILWENEGKLVFMTRPAVTVFEGELEIPHD